MTKHWIRFRGYILSAFLHLALFALFASVQLIPTLVTEEGVQVEWVNLDEDSVEDEALQRRQIVDQDKVALNDDTPLDNYKLSRHNQRVFEETKAKNRGDFKNTQEEGDNTLAAQGSKANSSSQDKVTEKSIAKATKNHNSKEPANKVEPSKEALTSNESQTNQKFSFNDFAPKTVQPLSMKRQMASLSSQGSGQAGSATDDYLKKVKTGTQTLLNTREFVYFSYYNRIKAKLKQQWEPQIKSKITRILQQGRQISTVSDKITRLVITLDKSGELVKIQVRGQSGYHELDEAAIDAFRAAAPFPNPPKGIQDKLGEIKINWDFVLES